MNKELFDSMNKQMSPSPEARAALNEKLAQPVKKRPTPWMKYGAVAACAALLIGGFSVYSLRQDPTRWMLLTQNFHHDALVKTEGLHSYVTVDGFAGGYTQENAEVTTATGGGDSEDGGGAIRDHDMNMTPEDLKQAMLDVGYTQEEIEEYQSIGYQMTWAKWWKFVDGQKNSEGDDLFNLDTLKSFSQKELYVTTGALPAPNTGALPGGAYVGDAPSQEEAVNAYEKLMDQFNGQYPDWYGGAYIDNTGTLVVQLVSDKDPGDKTLELQVLDWVGGPTSRVAFSSCKYSLAHLKGLMDRLNALPDEDMKYRDVMASWGVDEQANRIELTLTQIYEPLLAVLSELDPDDDAILVQVGQRASHDLGGENVTTDSAKTEDPVGHDVMPGGAAVPVPEGEDPIAYEPWYDGVRDGAHYDLEDLPGELPQQKLPAVDSVPEEDSSSMTAAYDPDVGFINPKS